MNFSVRGKDNVLEKIKPIFHFFLHQYELEQC